MISQQIVDAFNELVAADAATVPTAQELADAQTVLNQKQAAHNAQLAIVNTKGVALRNLLDAAFPA